MEHEVFVPVEAARLREVLDDPARVARAVPGLQHDAGADPVAGRLKIRVGGHSVTYRGAVRVSGRDDGSYTVEGEAAESRGTGSVKLTLRLRLRETGGGTTLGIEGAATADGRVTEFPADAVAAAVSRLLDRFAENLGTVAEEETGTRREPPGTASGPESPELLAAGDFEPRATTDFETAPDADDAPPAPAGPAESARPAEESGPAERTEESGPADGAEESERADGAERTEESGPAPETPSALGPQVPPSPPGAVRRGADEDSVAEAAHARRTMIGRSAEEVDHAPPRGRYAPVPAPQTVSPAAPLRWAAPAAALAVASAVVAVRALRRRR